MNAVPLQIISLVVVAMTYTALAFCAFLLASKWPTRKHLVRVVWASAAILFGIIVGGYAQKAGHWGSMLDDFCLGMFITLIFGGFFNRKFGV